MLAKILLAGAVFATVARSECYDRGGKITSDLPCDNGKGVSFCCPSGTQCMSNGICQGDDSFGQGGCTKKSFDDPACLEHCTNGNGFQEMTACLPNSAGKFVCAGEKCSDTSAQIRLGDMAKASVLPFLEVTVTTSEKATSTKVTSSTKRPTSTTKSKETTSSPTTKTSSSSSSTSTDSSTSSEATTTSSSTSSSSTTTQTSSSTSSTSTPTENPGAKSGMSSKTKVAMGLGIAGGVAALVLFGSILMFYIRRRSLKHDQDEKLNDLRAKEAARIALRNPTPGNDSGTRALLSQPAEHQTYQDHPGPDEPGRFSFQSEQQTHEVPYDLRPAGRGYAPPQNPDELHYGPGFGQDRAGGQSYVPYSPAQLYDPPREYGVQTAQLAPQSAAGQAAAARMRGECGRNVMGGRGP